MKLGKNLLVGIANSIRTVLVAERLYIRLSSTLDRHYGSDRYHSCGIYGFNVMAQAEIEAIEMAGSSAFEAASCTRNGAV
jgi:hypothetical protein